MKHLAAIFGIVFFSCPSCFAQDNHSPKSEPVTRTPTQVGTLSVSQIQELQNAIRVATAACSAANIPEQTRKMGCAIGFDATDLIAALGKSTPTSPSAVSK